MFAVISLKMDGIFVIKTLPKTFKIPLIEHYSQLYMHECLMMDKIKMTPLIYFIQSIYCHVRVQCEQNLKANESSQI